MAITPRVAFFSESLHEVNGVARTSRALLSYARRHGLPLLAVVPGSQQAQLTDGTVQRWELPAGVLSFALDTDIRFDLAFPRWLPDLRSALDRFAPDLVHVTGPGHIGFLGAILAHERRLPLVASWHTNVHQFGARRLEQVCSFLPQRLRAAACRYSERWSLTATLRFYRIAQLLLAPNPELVVMLEEATGRPCRLMQRGVDTHLFSPSRRTRKDREFVVGYVGRLCPEKNVRLLARLEDRLRAAGIQDYRFLVAGQGSEQKWLAARLRRASFPGVLQGAALAEAYANMDVFLFPSETDTFGNVVLEAMASGTPPVVMGKGGPKFLVSHGESGLVAQTEEELSEAVLKLYSSPGLLNRLRLNARKFAETRSWDVVFSTLYRDYQVVLPEAKQQTPSGRSDHESACFRVEHAAEVG
jgi:phosphatidylinositol alpha 1,6-mannosyltransferase